MKEHWTVEYYFDILFFKSNKIARWDVDKSASGRIKSVNRSRKEIAFGQFYTIVYLLFQFLSLASRRHRHSRFAVGGVCSFSEPPATLRHISHLLREIFTHDFISRIEIVSFSPRFFWHSSVRWQKSKSKCLFACPQFVTPIPFLRPCDFGEL